MKIEIENTTEEQEIKLVKLFMFMQACGSVGTSREVICYCDGDGSFRPKFKIEGEELKLPKIKSKYGDYEVLDEDKTTNTKKIFFE